jgi:hypothetical protein
MHLNHAIVEVLDDCKCFFCMWNICPCFLPNNYTKSTIYVSYDCLSQLLPLDLNCCRH